MTTGVPLLTGIGLVRLDEHGELVVGPLTAEALPSEAAELKAELSALLPFAPPASVLVELDRLTGFLNCFTHAARGRPPCLRRPGRASVLPDPAPELGTCGRARPVTGPRP